MESKERGGSIARCWGARKQKPNAEQSWARKLRIFFVCVQFLTCVKLSCVLSDVACVLVVSSCVAAQETSVHGRVDGRVLR